MDEILSIEEMQLHVYLAVGSSRIFDRCQNVKPSCAVIFSSNIA